MRLLEFAGARPDVASSAYVAHNATLVGEVTLGERSSVFFGAVLRGDAAPIRIGRETNIQDNAVLHADHGGRCDVGDSSSVGHSAVLHGCTIEPGCLIGIGAIVLNGAFVGAGSLVAAGTVLLENTTVPPGSLVVGSPGRVRRELTAEEQAGILANAAHYVDLARGYAAT